MKNKSAKSSLFMIIFLMSLFPILKSSPVYAEVKDVSKKSSDQKIIKEELKFEENDNLKMRYFAANDFYQKDDENTRNYIAKSKVYFAEYDLNDDGVDEYIVKVRTEREVCPRSDKPSCVRLQIFNKDFDLISYSHTGYEGKVIISSNRTNGYNDILLKCSNKNKKFERLLFNLKYKKYDSEGCECC